MSKCSVPCCIVTVLRLLLPRSFDINYDPQKCTSLKDALREGLNSVLNLSAEVLTLTNLSKTGNHEENLGEQCDGTHQEDPNGEEHTEESAKKKCKKNDSPTNCLVM